MENQLEHPTFQQLSQYLFGELTEEENQALDRLLLEVEYYYDIVQNLMQYCDQHNLYNRALLEKAIEEHKGILFEKMKNRSLTLSNRDAIPPDSDSTIINTKPSPPKFRWTSSHGYFVLFLLLFIGSTGWFFWNNYIRPTTPPPPPPSVPAEIAIAKTPEMEILLDEVWKEDKDRLNDADEDGWEDAFEKKRLDVALALLEEKIKKYERDQPQLFYFAGVLHLYLREGSPEKALDYLRRAKGFRKDPEYDYSKHLIIALASNKEYEEAAQLLDSFPQYKVNIPPDMLLKINPSKK